METLDLDPAKRERERQELLEGLEMLDKKKQKHDRDKIIEKRQMKKMLEDEPWPWGKPGAGAPNADTVRKRKVFLDSLPAVVGPADLPKTNLQLTHVTTMGRPGAGAPIRSKSGKIKVYRVEDPQLRFQFHAPIRNMVDNDLRYKQPFEEKAAYKKDLDQLIEQRRRLKSDQRRDDVIQDCKLGWTDPKLKAQLERAGMPAGNFQADYGHPSFESNNQQPSLPMLTKYLPPSKETQTWVVYVLKNPSQTRTTSPRSTATTIDSSSLPSAPHTPLRPLPESMPALANAIRPTAAHTHPPPPTSVLAPSPQVDPIKEPIWRSTDGEKEYHDALAHQIQEQHQRRQEERNQDLINSRKHFENWQNFWGRPGNGAPRSVKVKENLDYLLYHLPLITSKRNALLK